jgi:hypothetical protein
MTRTQQTSAAPHASAQLPVSRVGAVVLAVSKTVIIFALCVTVAQAQIAIDNTSFSSGDVTTLSFPHTVNSASDSLLMVGLAVHAQTRVTSVQWGTGSTNCSSTCSPASCLCGLTQVGTITDGGRNVTAQLWKLENPPAGSGSIIITLPSSHRIVSGATSFVEVDPTTPLGKAVTNSADSGAPANVSVPNASGTMVLDVIGASPNTTLTPTGAGQTQLYQASVSSSAGVSGAGSTAPGAATVTMSWSLDSSNWAIIAVPIIPAPTPKGGFPTPSPTATPTPTAVCFGDCDTSGSVSVDELVTLVNIALGIAQPSACPDGIPSGNGVNINLILTAVNHALNGCGSLCFEGCRD